MTARVPGAERRVAAVAAGVAGMLGWAASTAVALRPTTIARELASGCSRRPTRATGRGRRSWRPRPACPQLRSLCPLARAAREQGPAAVSTPTPRFCAQVSDWPSLGTHPGARRGGDGRDGRRSTSASPSSPTGAAHPPGADPLRRGPARGRPARRGGRPCLRQSLDRGRFRRGRGAAVPRPLRRRSATGRPCRAARPPAVGRADRPGAAHAAAGRPRRARPGRRAAEAAAVRPGRRGGAGGAAGAGPARRGRDVRSAALAPQERQRGRRARDPARPARTSCAGPELWWREQDKAIRDALAERSFKLAYRLASASRQTAGVAVRRGRMAGRLAGAAVHRPAEGGAAAFRAAVAGRGDADQPGPRRLLVRPGRRRGGATDEAAEPGTSVLPAYPNSFYGQLAAEELGPRPGRSRTGSARRHRRPRATRCGGARRRSWPRLFCRSRRRPRYAQPFFRHLGYEAADDPEELAAVVDLAQALRPRRPRPGRDPRRRRQRRLSGARVPIPLPRIAGFRAGSRRHGRSRRWCWPWRARRACSTRSRAARPVPWG